MYRQSASCDEAWNAAPNPKMADWPAWMLTTFTLTDGAAGETKLTFVWEPHNPTAAEAACFAKMAAMVSGGWNKGFDIIDQILAEGGEGKHGNSESDETEQEPKKPKVDPEATTEAK